MKRNDLLLVNSYEGLKEIQLSLEQVPINPVTGYLSAEEVKISRDWLLRQHFYEKHPLINPEYITQKRMLQFIHEAADNIVNRLSGNGSLPRMF
jgi:hypothetical protein